MSLWIRVICTQSLGQLTVADLRRGTEDGDFHMMAEMQDLDDELGDAAEQALRFIGPAGPLTQANLFYRTENPSGLSIHIQRWVGDQARGEAEELLETLQPEHTHAERIRAVLGKTIETVGFCLKQSDWDGMGFPISWHTAMWLGREGHGLVQVDDEWWDPVSYKRLAM